MVEITCACGCGRKKKVRQADINRGWGKFFNKSCKAKHQERRTGQHAIFLRRGGNPQVSSQRSTSCNCLVRHREESDRIYEQMHEGIHIQDIETASEGMNS